MTAQIAKAFIPRTVLLNARSYDKFVLISTSRKFTPKEVMLKTHSNWMLLNNILMSVYISNS